MADVQVQQSPRGSGATWAWAIVVIVLLAILAWFLFGRGMMSGSNETKIEVNTPAGNGSATVPKKP